MGEAIIREATTKGHQIVGAIEAHNNSGIGKTLKERGLANSDTVINTPDRIDEACANADVYISFTSPSAELENIPFVVGLGKRIVLGTTGFTEEQDQSIRRTMSKVPAVFSPNYSVGVNIFFKLVEILKAFPQDYNFSISEIHHTAKKDAPSGTALKLGQMVADARGYKTTIHGRSGISIRKSDELEIVAMRAGGVPGIHDLIVAGPAEMLRIEHTAFSRNVLAQGAVIAAEWVSRQQKTGVFSMATVLGL